MTNPETTPESREVVGRASRLIQKALLPRNAPSLKGYDIAAGTSLLEEGGLGGTIWDAFPLERGRVALVTLDIRGGSSIPAHHLALARILFRELREEYGELARLVPRVNQALHRSSPEGLDVPVESGIVVLGPDALEWASAGQLPGAVIRRDGTFVEFTSHGPPLGMLDGFQYGTQRVTLEAGDMVIVLSHISQGLFRGAADLLVSLQGQAAGEIVGKLHRAIRRAQGEKPREVTVVFVRKH